jgi:hypothetical protein
MMRAHAMGIFPESYPAIHFVNELPVGNTGKADRGAVARTFEEARRRFDADATGNAG